MPTVKKLSEIKKLVTPELKKTILKSIGEAITEELIDEYNEEIYSYNESSLTERTYGFQDKDNYDIIVDNNKVEVYSTLKPNHSVIGTELTNPNVTLAEWIEHGDIPNIFNENDYEWMHPRPVVKNVKDEIYNNKEDFVNIVINTLRKNGFNAKKNK